MLDKEDDDARYLLLERKVKAAVRKRDGRCRWPEKHKCRCGLEAAHIRDASLGGELSTENLVLLCGFLHRRGPESIHQKQLRIDPETERGADGALSFWRKGEDGVFYLVARETSPGVVERD